MLRTKAIEELCYVVGLLRLDEGDGMRDSIIFDYRGLEIAHVSKPETTLLTIDFDLEGMN